MIYAILGILALVAMIVVPVVRQYCTQACERCEGPFISLHQEALCAECAHE